MRVQVDAKELDKSNGVSTREVWWKTATCYQVWPASYKDSNGDGLGDIPGIISTLDYLKDLGVDVIWLSPIYASPQADMGYDISNYEDVYPPYGTLDDMDRLIAGMKARNMKLLMDLVINHTSDQHKWFLESKTNRTNSKADWYHWRNPKYVNGQRQPPNNWRASFGGSAWSYVPDRDQYYLHIYEPQQPDLNWESDACRQGIYDSAVRFWLRRGVAGFRMDVVNFYCKDTTFPDAPITEPDAKYQPGGMHYVNGPRMHEWLRELRSTVFDEFGAVMTVGECPRTPFEECLKYVSASRKELSMIFDFDLVVTGGNRFGTARADIYKPPLAEIKEALWKTQKFSAGSDAWATVFGENHDFGRSVSRFGNDSTPFTWSMTAKLLSMLFASLTGTLFIYQGQEIGMTGMPKSWGPSDLMDIAAIKSLGLIAEQYPDDDDLLERSMEGLRKCGRDNSRTPVQWSAEPNAGFCDADVKPWMQVLPNYTTINVTSQINSPTSVLSFWRRMLQIRKQYSGLFIYGGFELLDIDNEKTFTFVKEDMESKAAALVVLNFSGEEGLSVGWPKHLEGRKKELLVTNVDGVDGQKEKETLGAYEGRIYLLS